MKKLSFKTQFTFSLILFAGSILISFPPSAGGSAVFKPEVMRCCIDDLLTSYGGKCVLEGAGCDPNECPSGSEECESIGG